MQRTIAVWTQTAIKNGAKRTYSRRRPERHLDWDKAWGEHRTGKVGRTLLIYERTKRNGRQTAPTCIQERGGGQPQTWIDHILHKGESNNISYKSGYVSHVTDRRKVDEFVEHMERYGTERLGPTEYSSLDEVMESTKDMQHQMARKVKQLYLRAGKGETRSSLMDGCSPAFIDYKAHLTALVLICRHLMGHRGARKWTSPDIMRQDRT